MKVSVVGAGSFGTAIAQTISSNVSQVSLFGRDEEVMHSINEYHINQKYHPFVKLNPNVQAFHIVNDAEGLQESDLVIFSVPSGAIRQVARNLKKYLEDKVIVSTAKGIEFPALSTMSTIINEEADPRNVISFSGPTFADELMHGFFSCATLGIDDHKKIDTASSLLRVSNLILDFSSDVTGVEWCGVLKNVYAIATGIFDSVVVGNNEHYGFLSLCYKEMKYILASFSFDQDLSNKFCAFGDLNLTANVDKSRNRILGFVLGKLWVTPKDFKSNVVVEGVKAAAALRTRCDALGLDAPIVGFVNTCLNDPKLARESLQELIWQR